MTPHELNQLWDDYYAKVYGYFFRRVNSAQDAEDLTLEVMKKFFDILEKKGDEIENQNAYLWKIASNQLFLHIKQRQKHPFSLGEDDTLDSVKSSLDQYRSKAYQERIEALMQCVERNLKDLDYQIVYQSLVEDRKSYEVAERLDLKPDNVRQRLSRSIKKIRQICAQLWLV